MAMKYPWMPLFWGDFLANTMDLSAQEAGAYLFLIAHAWEHGGEIPSEPVRLARIAHVRLHRWKRVWLRLEKFFERRDEVPLMSGTPQQWYHCRVADELHRLGKISSKRKAAAEQMLSKCSELSEQMLRHPTSRSIKKTFLNGDGKRKRYFGISPDEGEGYRSPPRTKADNPLQPLPDKPQRAAPKPPSEKEVEISEELRKVMETKADPK
jgi:uncharacterized protein YdaU (DUF1376 family)